MNILRKVKIGTVTLNNPLMTASGTFGYGKEFADFMDLSILGGIVTKTISVKPRGGNPSPRIYDLGYGVINSIGLENPGVKAFKEQDADFCKTAKTRVFVSIYGLSPHEWKTLVNELNIPAVAGFELNFSCPNLQGKIAAYDRKKVASVISRLRPLTNKPLIAKLSFCPHITDVANAAQRAGADALTVINTLPAVAVDSATGKFVLGNIYGGLSGPCIKPVALKCVYDVSRTVSIPVIGCGGITQHTDVLEFIACGATAVQIGTANITSPDAARRLVHDLTKHGK